MKHNDTKKIVSTQHLLESLECYASDKYEPIKCHVYDYIEIACLHKYRLEIELVNSQIISAIAESTLIKDKAGYKAEYLVATPLSLSASEPVELRLDTIAYIRPLDKYAQFGRVKIHSENPTHLAT